MRQTMVDENLLALETAKKVDSKTRFPAFILITGCAAKINY